MEAGMKFLRCEDVTGFDCRFVAKAKSAEQAKRALLLHGTRYHKDMMDKMYKDDLKLMMEQVERVFNET